MLVNSDAELMYPSLDGLAGLIANGLGCGGDCGCGCKKRGIGSLFGPDTNQIKQETGDIFVPTSTIPWYCEKFGIMCPTPEEIARDESNYGPALTQENRDKATQMTLDIIRKENPCDYSEINGMSEWDKMVKCGDVNWVKWGVIGVSLYIVLKK